MTTAEYAVGTVGAAGLGAVLLWAVRDSFFTDFIQSIIGKVLSWSFWDFIPGPGFF